MAWLREQVWQSGIAVLLALVASWLIYAAAAGDPVDNTLLWVGLILMFVALAIPLFSKIYLAASPGEGQQDEG